ncbi:MAG: hypothetical protein M9962_08030 [Oligoflexia bacterium]|nr:hypothetical protein [Oligoflexia bacterium]
MRIKLYQILFIFFCSLLLISSSEAARKDKRQARQKARIQQGANSGELTNLEKRKLKQGQKRIRKAEKKAMSDGNLSSEEKAKLEKMQDKQSKKIHRLKHNDRKKPEDSNNSSGDISSDLEENLPISE